MLNKNSILNFGKYQGYKLKNIPDTYLEAFYLSHVHIKLEESDNRKDLVDYIDKNYNFSMKLKTTLQNSLEVAIDIKEKCPKEFFVNKEDARYRMQHIKSINKTGKTPVRPYLCPKCGFWHLTSQESVKYKNKHSEIESIEGSNEETYNLKYKTYWEN